MGAWQLANPEWDLHDTDEALRIVQAALDAGCTFFDTAPGYGGGRSEELLGQALAPVRDQVTICTKFSHDAPDGTHDFDPAAIRPTLEASLRRLKTDYVDILLLHNPPVELMDGQNAPHYEELERLKAEGKLRVYGVSLDARQELETVIETTNSGAVEIYFNAFYQEPLPAFRLAQEHGVGLIVKVPLDSGWLSGRYRGDMRFTDPRSRWSPETIARRSALIEEFAMLIPAGTSLTHAALQYVLAQQEVSTVIPGAKSVAQVRDNMAAAQQRLPDEVVQAIAAFYERHLKDNPLGWF